MKAIRIESDRLIYEPLDSSFASDSYLEWMNNPQVIRHLESGGDYDLKQLTGFLKEVEQKEILFWAIIIKASNKHIGNIKIDPVNWETKIGEYGIMMGDVTEWGKGYAYEASKTIMDYCVSDKIGLREITLGVYATNVAAVKLYERLGFRTYEAKRVFHRKLNTETSSLRMSLKVD